MYYAVCVDALDADESLGFAAAVSGEDEGEEPSQHEGERMPSFPSVRQRITCGDDADDRSSSALSLRVSACLCVKYEKAISKSLVIRLMSVPDVIDCATGLPSKQHQKHL